MHPINIVDVAIHWSGVTGSSVYRLRFANGRGTMDVFTSCTVAECVYPMPVDVWRAIVQPNADGDVTLTVGAAGAQVRRSAPIQLHVSPSEVLGSLYYWSTRSQGLLRLNFGERKATPYRPGGVTPGSGCVGCHSLGRKGHRIAWVGTGGWAAAATDAMGPSQPGSGSWPAVNTDGTKVLAMDLPGASLYDITTPTPTLVTKVDPAFLQNKFAMFPEWSPDDKEIALGIADALGFGSLGLSAGSGIAILPYNDGKFGPIRVLVPGDAETTNYYPSWSPDGKWIVFSSAKGVTYNNPLARLRLIAASGGTIYELGNATQGVGTIASWPKFSPFSQAGGQVMFIGFSSVMSYGYLLKRQPKAGGAMQLWFAAIDLRRLGTGDPSWAPIWLPFQEVTQSNHIPLWSQVEIVIP
jgi:hypothetical protein